MYAGHDHEVLPAAVWMHNKVSKGGLLALQNQTLP
jgi:hypothetical protein